MMENTNFYKIIKDSGGAVLFRLYVNFLENFSLNVVLLKERMAWSSTAGPTEIAAQAAMLDLTTEVYYLELKKYLGNVEEKTIDFKFDEPDFNIHLLNKDNMKIKLFWMVLKEVPFSVCCFSVLDNVFADFETVSHKFKNVQEDNSQLKRSNNDIKEKLLQLTERKKQDEEELYNKFVVLLNEKKRRIQHLNELLLAFKKGRPVYNAPVTVTKNKANGRVKSKTEIKNKADMEVDEPTEVEYESDHDYNTDEEGDSKVSTNLNVLENTNEFEPQPSTSKNDDFLIDSSPPHYNLPKRVKSDPLVGSLKSEIKQIFPEKIFDKETFENNLTNELAMRSTNVTSTQDLLDDM